MSPDLKQTLPSELCKTQDDKDIGLSTTLIQPTSRTRQSELSRTRYWEERSSEDEKKRPPASSHGNTRIGLGPDDPLVQAVNAVKLQLMQATQPVTPQPPAAQQPEPQPELPKRHSKPIMIACAALGILVCAAASFALTNKHSAKPSETPALVRPAPPPAATTEATPEPSQTQAPLLDIDAASERAAVDALFAGDYALAQRHYATLAQTHPDQPAFAEAARILSRKAASEPE